MVALTNLRTGHTKSCGCLKKINSTSIHNMSSSRIYSIWCNIKNRCMNSNIKAYKNYGGRGIKYDRKWEKFTGFYEDMKDGYEDHLTIDRIHNDWGYSKENCRWATYKEQNRNRRNNIRYKGKCIVERCEELGLNQETIYARIHVYGWSIERALEMRQ